MLPLSILQITINVAILTQIIIIAFFGIKKRHWTAVLQVSLSTIVLALIVSEILFFGRFSTKVAISVILQCLVTCLFWRILKRFENN